MKIKSDFAILDVKTGRGALNKRCDRGHDMSDPVPVIIRGYIMGRHGSFDGTSQEFTVHVTQVESPPDEVKE